MSIDFSKITGISDQYGNIVKITDAAWNVLWKQAPSGANVKVTLNNGGTYATRADSPMAYLNIDGVKHNVAEEIVLPIGTVIQCYITISSSGTTTKGIYVNGEQVSYTVNERYRATYDYTVTGDIEIVLRSSMAMSGSSPSFEAIINITEL